MSDLIVVMREQSTIEGRGVDGVTGEVVPLAKYWLRELAWPYRGIGTPQDPLSADVNGRFIVSNVFTGAFGVTAVDPGNQELRGDYQGTLAAEGAVGLPHESPAAERLTEGSDILVTVSIVCFFKSRPLRLISMRT